MADGYIASSREEAEQIAETLKQLDAILAGEGAAALEAGDLSGLRRDVRKMLVGVRTDLEALAAIDREDVFKTNPVFATQRHQLIQKIESAKIDFEFDILPAITRLTEAAAAKVAGAPAGPIDPKKLPPPEGGPWTVEKVLKTAERFTDQAAKAVGVAAKGVKLVKALGLLTGALLL